MTEEQWIVIGLLAAAFVVGWLASALVGRRDRPGAGVEAPAAVIEGDLEQAVAATRADLDRAIESHVAALAFSSRARDPEGAPGGPLTEEVSAALQDDAANECMVSALDGHGGNGLSERDLDLADWGFAYGVAWARARERIPSESDDFVAHEALGAARAVFSEYAPEAEWGPAHPGASES